MHERVHSCTSTFPAQRVKSPELSPVACHLSPPRPKSLAPAGTITTLAALAKCCRMSVAYKALGLRERIKFSAIAYPVYEMSTPDFAFALAAEASVPCRLQYERQWYTGTSVQTSSRHQNSCACTLRSGVRVNEPGTGRHSTVHSSTRDTLTFKSIFDLLASHMLRRDETSQNGVFLPNEPDSLFACLSQQTVSFHKVVTGCLHRRVLKPRYRTSALSYIWSRGVSDALWFHISVPHNAVPQQ